MFTPPVSPRLVADARAFLTELSANNEKPWWEAQKPRYDRDLKAPALALLEALVPDLAAWSGQPVSTKLFRPHRDVRFSKDKTPYTTHLHLLWSVPDGRGWFFGVSPDYVTAGAGIMDFSKDQLTAFRAAVDSGMGDDLTDALEAGGWSLREPALKRVPKPYDADHTHADLLRHKELVVWRDDPDGVQDDPETALRSTFRAARPVQDWLAEAMKP